MLFVRAKRERDNGAYCLFFISADYTLHFQSGDEKETSVEQGREKKGEREKHLLPFDPLH